MKKLIIGIDISAETLDICLKTDLEERYEVIENEISVIKKFFKSLTCSGNCNIIAFVHLRV